MILFADESVPEAAIAALEALDYQAVHARAVLHAGAPRSVLFRVTRGTGGTFLTILPPGPRLVEFADAARDAGVSAFVVVGRVPMPAALTTLLIRAWRAMAAAERDLHPPFVCAVDGRGRVRRLRTAPTGCCARVNEARTARQPHVNQIAAAVPEIVGARVRQSVHLSREAVS